jgi:hypothetical protein
LLAKFHCLVSRSDIAVNCKLSVLGHMSRDTSWDTVECRGPGAMVEHYLIVSCGLSPVVDVVTAIQKKDISRVDPKRPAALGRSTQAPIDLVFLAEETRAAIAELLRRIKTGATEVSLSGQNWENLQLTAKLTRPAPRRHAAADRIARVTAINEEPAHTIRSRGPHRIGRAYHLPERREWLLRRPGQGPGPWSPPPTSIAGR